MARVQYSALVNRIFGLLGNSIYQRYKGTDYIRTSPAVWTNPNSHRQQQVRANLTQLSKAWDSLPPSHKELWFSYASFKGCNYFGAQSYISLNCNLLNASHADLTCISHPPLRPGTPKHIQGFCAFPVTTTSTCLSWTIPTSNILYVTGYYRLHRGFCASHPSYGCCAGDGYRPSFRFVKTVRSDTQVIIHTYDYPVNTRLFYKLNSLDKFGRKSPVSHVIKTFSVLYPDYNKRIKITADFTKVDSDLSHFPLTIFLKAGNGETSKIFDEIGSNYKKIAVTKSDCTTQLFVEVEKWDSANKIGILHCGLSGDVLSSSSDTDYYIYYDNDHADNTTYVGDIGSSPGQSVWDSHFEMILHMVDYDNSNIHDSTSHGIDGAKQGANNPNEVEGKVGEAQDFDGTSSYVSLGNNIFDTLANNSFSLDLIFKPDVLPTGSDYDNLISLEGRIATLFSSAALSSWQFGFFNGSLWYYVNNSSSYSAGQYIYFTCEWDKPNNLLYLYINGGNVQSVSSVGSPDTSQNRPNCIGCIYTLSSHFSNGIIDEIRISSSKRGPSWSKATYNSLYDTLLTYGNEVVFT